MPTLSGSYDFNQTRNEIISDALELLGVIGEGETPSNESNTFAARQLERMVKHWQGQGIHLWTRQQARLFVTPSQASYDLGSSSSDHATLESDFNRTALGADASSGASTITVDSITNISDGDNIGVVLDDDTFHWTTVNGAPSGSTVTLTSTLSGDAAEDNYVYTYTTDLIRPLKIIDAQRRDESNSQDTPIVVFSHEEYQNTPNKTNEGETNELYYHPTITSDLGKIYLWPVPETVARTIRMTCMLPLQDFDSAGNNADFPTEWLDCLVWNLAKRLIPKYGVAGQNSAQMIIQGGSMMLQEMLAWDQEPESIFFQPNMTNAHG